MSVRMNKNLVDAAWLARHKDNGNVVVLCASMGDKAASANGVPGAFLADIDGEFSDADDPRPHTCPPLDDLRRAFQRRGISDDTAVVVYDRHGMVVAPRVWWLLKVVGLDNVAVLNGGLKAWVAAGYSTEPLADPSNVSCGTITAPARGELLVDIDEVARHLNHGSAHVVDARSAGRFSGEDPEPRPGMPSGHMPGARNIPFTEVFPAGTIAPPDVLADHFDRVGGPGESYIFSCGSGVTACVDALAAIESGRKDVRVYDGSWSEWAAPGANRPIAVGE
ncbi:sulfurtransferase [Corynebacterium mendelii]|nr:sulfurtransferase [Corynebacterium mendelii]